MFIFVTHKLPVIRLTSLLRNMTTFNSRFGKIWGIMDVNKDRAKNFRVEQNSMSAYAYP